MGGGDEGGLSPSSLPSFFFRREFFSRALLSERLEQATYCATTTEPWLPVTISDVSRKEHNAFVQIHFFLCLNIISSVLKLL